MSKGKLMNCNDYRNTRYCRRLEDIQLKKEDLKNEIMKDHPRLIDHYRFISNNNLEYKNKFSLIYNKKCAYCGISYDLIGGIGSFEIDHFIYKRLFNRKCEAGDISNLVLACPDCNRKKSSFLISNKYRELLNPDFRAITDVFVRDELFYIVISAKYKNDKIIHDFYEKLKLNSEFCRLDYLLMSIIKLVDFIENSNFNTEQFYPVFKILNKTKKKLFDLKMNSKRR